MLGESVTIVRQGSPTGAYDSQQNPIISAPVSIVSDGWAVAPRMSEETAQPFGQATIDGYTLYRREPVVVLPSDRFIVRGETWLVDGDSGVWVNPYAGVERGVTVNLTRGE